MNSHNPFPLQILTYMASSFLTYDDQFNLSRTCKFWNNHFYKLITHVSIDHSDFQRLMARNYGKGLDVIRAFRNHFPKLEKLDVFYRRSGYNYYLRKKTFLIRENMESYLRGVPSFLGTSSATTSVPSVSKNPSMATSIHTPNGGIRDLSKIPEESFTKGETVANHETSVVSAPPQIYGPSLPQNSSMGLSLCSTESDLDNSMIKERNNVPSQKVPESEEDPHSDEENDPMDVPEGLLGGFPKQAEQSEDLVYQIAFGEPVTDSCFSIGLLHLNPDHAIIKKAKFWLNILQQLGYCNDFSIEDESNSQSSLSEFYHLNLIHDCLQAMERSGINPQHVKFLDNEQFSAIISNSRWKELSAIKVKQLYDLFSEGKPEIGMPIENCFIACLWVNQLELPPSKDSPPYDELHKRVYHLVTVDEHVKKCFRVYSTSQTESFFQKGRVEEGHLVRTGESSFKVNCRGEAHFVTRKLVISNIMHMQIKHASFFLYWITNVSSRLECEIIRPREKISLRRRKDPFEALLDSMIATNRGTPK